MDKDLKVKRAQFIQTCMAQNDEFECLDMESQIKLLNIYNSHFTGSSLWNFDSENFKQLIRSWNVNLRVISNLPMQTHTYLIERISGCKHAKQKIFSRYISFMNSLLKSNKYFLRSLFKLVSKDARSFTGSNLKTILKETGELIVPGNTSKGILSNFTAYETPTDQEWRIPLLVSLLEIRNSNWIVTFDEEDAKNELDKDDIEKLIQSVCIL